MILREIYHQEVLRTEAQAEDELFQVTGSCAEIMTGTERCIILYKEFGKQQGIDHDHPGYDRPPDPMIHVLASDGKS